jgi:hypothetical protein
LMVIPLEEASGFFMVGAALMTADGGCADE